MSDDKGLSRAEISSALADLDAIARDEYPASGGLEGLLADPTPDGALRVQRVVGISLKRDFADKRPAGYTQTQARYAWLWKPGAPPDEAHTAPKELALLEKLRKPGPWNELSQHGRLPEDISPITWDQFKDDVEHERGLFKIVILYAVDRINGTKRKTFKEYLDSEESAEFEAGLDLTDKLVDYAVLAPLYATLGVPGVAVGVALVLFRWGYRQATDTQHQRVGDANA